MENFLYSLVCLSRPKPDIIKYFNAKYAYAYTKTHRLDLLKENTKVPHSLENLQKKLNQTALNQNYDNAYFLHLSYEYGFLFFDNEALIPQNEIIAIEIEYQNWAPFKLDPQQSVGVEYCDNVDSENYKSAFRKGRVHLEYGDCYQFNLTRKLQYRLSRGATAATLSAALWKDPQDRGAYAHMTNIPSLNQCLLSNSPECLFQAYRQKRNLQLFSAPIKGTIPFTSKDNFETIWSALTRDEKEGAELDMITDLIRNDLNRLETPVAKVLERMAPLKVPGILHQYSLIAVKCSLNLTLGRVLRCLFPGGSITGAPKKKVMEILRTLELEPRGFYTGSTFIGHKGLVAAAINIRTAEVDFKRGLLTFGAGGGITLKSDSNAEWTELLTKAASFSTLLD